jgi:hypothetical protein
MINDKRILALSSFEGFNDCFEQQLKYHNTMPEAFLAVSNIYFKYYGKERYSSYESFKQVRNRHIKQNKIK